MTIRDYWLSWLAHRLPLGSSFRAFGKRLIRGWVIKQRFHSGVICFDALEYSFLWLMKNEFSAQEYDRYQQDILQSLSFDYPMFMDIGSSIGIMSLSVLLRNPSIRVVCVDANRRAMQLLRQSVRLNKLESRVSLVEAVVSDTSGEVKFDDSLRTCSHISDTGSALSSITLEDLLKHYAPTPCFVKIDVEGAETLLLKQLPLIENLRQFCFFIELHPLGFNKLGDPHACIDLLRRLDASILDPSFKPIASVQEDTISSIIVRWHHA